MKKFWFFPALVVLMVVMGIFVFINFNDTKTYIKQDIFEDSLKNVEVISSNIVKYINKNFDLEKLKKDEKLKLKADEYLESFISLNYKNIFIVYPKNKFFIALADGSKTERFDFKEKFKPLNKLKWNEVLKTKKPLYFTQDIKGIWTTFLYPIIENNKVKAILVIDFSTKPVKLVENSLTILKRNVEFFILTIFIFIIVLVGFTIYDYKRQKQLKKLVIELQNLNDTLEERVKEEVEKNIQKDKQLELQSRMALMGELLSMIAHQWRQPLNALSAIVSNLKLDLMLGSFDKNELAKTIDKMENLIVHLSHTIDDFRKFYREDNEFVKIKISQIIDDAINIVSASLNAHSINLKVDIKEDFELKTMPNRLKQVLLNIIKNASDVLEERKIKNPTIKIEVKNKTIFIKDNAGGIKDDIIDKIFEPYFTTKDEKNGTGLGLYMSKTIIEKLNGKIKAYNDENGAVFKIELKDIDGNK